MAEENTIKLSVAQIAEYIQAGINNKCYEGAINLCKDLIKHIEKLKDEEDRATKP